MIHGRGEQYWMTKTYEKYRQLALEWRFRFSDEDLEDYNVSSPQGDGRHYTIKNRVLQSPFPLGTTQTPKYVNIRYHPRVG